MISDYGLPTADSCLPADFKKAIEIAEKVFKELPTFVKIGLSEKEVAQKIRSALKKHGAKKEAFRIIVASGKNSTKIHGFAGRRKIKQGDIVMFDFGALYNTFRSDITRTYIMGKPTKKHKKIWALLLKAQKGAIEKIKAGTSCKVIDLTARAIIQRAGHGENFIHSTGHAVRHKIHEYPRIRSKSRGVLEEGDVVTIEPGIYIKGWGGMRVEDMVLVTKRGHRVLTRLPQTLTLNPSPRGRGT